MTKKFERWGALPVYHRHCMAATADGLATQTAVDILREGGNAIDAAVAAAFVLCVTQPGMCGLGGGGHLLARFSDGQFLCLDFREQAPLGAARDMFQSLPDGASLKGWAAAATPGTVRGLGEAWRRSGTLPWKRLVAPAIAIAAEGHPVSYLRSRMLAGCAALYEDPESYRILLRSGLLFEPGDILRQPELAATLERIADQGAEEFYSGETAHRLSRVVKDHQGIIGGEDLARYTCALCEPLIGNYRDREICTMPPSSAGGFGLLQTLAILDGTPFADDGPGSSQFFHYLAEALRRSFADRAACIGDPAFETVPKHLLDPAHIDALRRTIDPLRATPSAEAASASVLRESGCTTHVSVLDSDGNAAALTFTLNGIYGCGVTIPGLGFLLNNNMDNFSVKPDTPNQYGMMQNDVNAIRPGKRPVSSMTPTIVCDARGVEMVMGTPGGPTIVSATVQALLYILEFGWNARDAVEGRRIHHQWMPDTLFVEEGIAADVLKGLEQRGHRVQAKPPLTDMNVIVRRTGYDETWIEGAVDSRRESVVAGF
jgi:gamma-glutamyltranspeptidase/glutathione hydrolase